MSRFFKSRPKKPSAIIETVAPRELEAIQKEYMDLIGQAGQIQYKNYISEKDLERVNAALLRVNQEAQARMDLDKAAKAQEPTQEVKSE